jgi:RecJ-like exonuclease
MPNLPINNQCGVCEGEGTIPQATALYRFENGVVGDEPTGFECIPIPCPACDGKGYRGKVA